MHMVVASVGNNIKTKEYQENEIAILAMINDSIFTCNVCDWTIPIEEMSEVNDDWRCRDCD